MDLRASLEPLGSRQAETMLRRAVELDPECGACRCGLAAGLAAAKRARADEPPPQPPPPVRTPAELPGPGPPPSVSTSSPLLPSLVRRLDHDLRATAPPGATWAFCSGSVEHVIAEPEDRFYSCGYRNIQMVLSSLRNADGTWPPALAARLGGATGALPSIRALQTILEAAWADGAPKPRPRSPSARAGLTAASPSRDARCDEAVLSRVRPAGSCAAKRTGPGNAQVDRSHGGGRRVPMAWAQVGVAVGGRAIRGRTLR